MMINPTDKGEERQERPSRLHSKGLSHTGRRRNYKLIVDPEIHGKQYEKQYRFDGHTKGGSPIELRDPRKKVHFALTTEVSDLPVPHFKYDQNYVGELPERQLFLSNLNDNVNKEFLRDMCSKHGSVESVRVYSHPQTKRHLGMASILFKTARVAKEARRHLHDHPIMGLVVTAQMDATGSLAKQHVNYLLHPDSAPKPSALPKQPTKTSTTLSDTPSSSLITQIVSSASSQSKNLSYSQKFSMMLAGNPEIEPISPSPPHEISHMPLEGDTGLCITSPPPPPPPPPQAIPSTPPLPPGPPPSGLALTRVSTETRQPVALEDNRPPLPWSSPTPSRTGRISPKLKLNGSLSPSTKRANRNEDCEGRANNMSPQAGKSVCEDTCLQSNSSGYNSATNGIGTPGSGDDQMGGKESVLSLTNITQKKHTEKEMTENKRTEEDMDVSDGSDNENPSLHKPSSNSFHPLPSRLPPLPTEPPPLPPSQIISPPPLPSGPPPPLPPLPPKSLPIQSSLPPLPPPVPPHCPVLPPIPPPPPLPPRQLSQQIPQLPSQLPFFPMSHVQRAPIFFMQPALPPVVDAFRARHPAAMIDCGMAQRLRYGEQGYRSRRGNHYGTQQQHSGNSYDDKHNRQVDRLTRLKEIEMKDKERIRKTPLKPHAFREGSSQIDLVLDKVSEAIKLDILGVLKRDITKQLERRIIDDVELWWQKKTEEEEQKEEEVEEKSELGSLSLRVGGMSIKVDRNGLVTREPLPKMPSFLKRSLPVQPARLPGMTLRQDVMEKGAKRSLSVSDNEDEEEPTAKRRIEDVWSDEDSSDHVESESESEGTGSASSESDRESGSEFSAEDMEESESELEEDKGLSVEESDMIDVSTTEPVSPTKLTDGSMIDGQITGEVLEERAIPQIEVSQQVVTVKEPSALPQTPVQLMPLSIKAPVPLSSNLLPSNAFVLPTLFTPMRVTTDVNVLPTATKQDEPSENSKEVAMSSEEIRSEHIETEELDTELSVSNELENRETKEDDVCSPLPLEPEYTCRSEAEETEVLQQFFSHLDDEDRKLMRLAFMQLQESNDPCVKNTRWTYHPSFPSTESMVDEWTGGAYRRHKAGCARCEGYYKISNLEKRRYLKRRISTSDKTDANQQESGKARQLSRVNRVQFRRVAAEFGTTTSLITLNQLDIRKKLLKFARSSIHGWGLYALEHIAADEMVIEYVGEVVRNEVADRREKTYEQRGMGSSYMFRVDQENVIDATHRGNFARFINHCCEPNCTAKVINVGCQKRIVIYSKRDIQVNEEITYDYKFPLEEDKIDCLCGAPGCRGSLN